MRNCEYIGNPAMFRSRVSGLGSIEPGGRSPYAPVPGAPTREDGWAALRRVIEPVYCIGPNCQMDGGLSKLQVCHPQSPAGTCKPVDWTPPAVVPDAPAKPASAGSAKPTGSVLPLVIGAALLLLS